MFIDEASTDGVRPARSAVADRVARDLHDVVMQRLFATGLQLQGLAAVVGGSAGDTLTDAVAGLDQTMADVRAAIVALRLGEAGDPPSLRTALLDAVADPADQQRAAEPGMGR